MTGRHLMLIASDVKRVQFNGATPEQVTAVSKLMTLSRFIAEHCRSVMMDGQGPWLELAGMMDAAGRLCRNEDMLAQELASAALRMCGLTWGSGCVKNNGGAHTCGHPKPCTIHTCACGVGC